MKNRRIQFFILWTFLTILGIVLETRLKDAFFTLYYILGFRTPTNAFYMLGYFGLVDYYPPLFVLVAFVPFVCLILWFITLLRINKSRMLERLIVADRITALLLWVLLLLSDEWELIALLFPAGLAVETVVIVFLIRLAKRKGWWDDTRYAPKPKRTKESNKE